MKLMIVDDEKLTRQGMYQNIDWASLGITEIFDADDGINGVALAKEKEPDIILSDIRMPRMNGINMLENIRTFLPDVNIIFMSGYSDREYLMAAIKLKAVSYVEKPIDPLELEEAILSAVENNELLKRTKQSATLHSHAKAGRLALSMTYPPEQREVFSAKELLATDTSIRINHYFTTIILKSVQSLGDFPEEILSDIHNSFDRFLLNFALEEMHIIKHDQYLVYHIFGSSKPSERILMRICEFLRSALANTSPLFLAVGETVSNIENTWKSYNTAVILLQSSFFYDYNSILFPQAEKNSFVPAYTDQSAAYMEALLSKNPERISRIEDSIYDTFRNCRSLLPNKVKDLYYKLFVVIQNACRKLSLNTDEAFASSDIILEYVQNCHILPELHKLLTDKSQSFLRLSENQKPESASIFAIKDYISHNYHRDGLSVKEIGDYIHMSSSYVCTIFKSETGLTLNQYITNYRIEKAKLLLADSQYKITDISGKVGYTDSNYFGKSFRKQVGLSPSEYREKILL